MRRFRFPRHAGAPEDAAGWERFQVMSADGASRLDLWLRGTSGDLRFEAFGGPELIAAADWSVERTLSGELRWPPGVTARELVAILALPAEAAGAMLLVERAFRAAFGKDMQSVLERSR